MTMTEPRSPGRPRDVSRAPEILQAARAELAANGYNRMTMAAVAARAGAGKATVYRRWASKAELVLDAVAGTSDAAQVLERIPDTGSLAGDLHELRSLQLNGQAMWHALAGLVSELQSSPALASVVHERLVQPRVDVIRGLLERAAARGELHSPDADLDLLAGVPAAMIAYRLLVSGLPLDAEFLARMCDEVLVPLATGSTGALPRGDEVSPLRPR